MIGVFTNIRKCSRAARKAKGVEIVEIKCKRQKRIRREGKCRLSILTEAHCSPGFVDMEAERVRAGGLLSRINCRVKTRLGEAETRN